MRTIGFPFVLCPTHVLHLKKIQRRNVMLLLTISYFSKKASSILEIYFILFTLSLIIHFTIG